MRNGLIILTATLLLAGCTCSSSKRQVHKLQGAWTLTRAEYPVGLVEDYSLEGSGTFCLIYEGDSILYECRMAATPSGLIIIPTAKSSVTLIDKGGGELLYLEDGDPHPLTLSDSIIAIQQNGILLTMVRADDIYRDWGSDIRDIIEHELEKGGADEGNRYVLSATERQQERTIQWYSVFSALIILLALMAAHVAIISRRDRRQLQLQLQQIQEVQENRPQAVRKVAAKLESEFFGSDEYAALQKRMAGGRFMSDDEWQPVEQHLKTVYPGFISQLRSLYPMSSLEYHTCLLIKLRIAPKDIAAVLARDISTISTVRSRLYMKVFGRKSGAKDWDDFILSIGV